MALIRPIPTNKGFIDLDTNKYLLATRTGSPTGSGTITSGTTITAPSAVFTEIIANVKNFNTMTITDSSESIGTMVNMIGSDGSVTTGDQLTTDISNAEYIIISQACAFPGASFTVVFS